MSMNDQRVAEGSGTFARSVGVTACIGTVTGAVSAAVFAGLTCALGGDSYGSPAALIAIAVVYGAGVGLVAGWAIGLPVVAVAASARGHTAWWRELGAAAAGGIVLVAWAVMGGMTDPAALILTALVAVPVALVAWWGLGRVFTNHPGGGMAREASTLSG